MLTEKQSIQPFSERFYDNQELIDRLRDSNNRIDNQLTSLKQSIKRVNDRRKALTSSQQLKTFNDVTVTRLLAKRFGAEFNDANYQKCLHDLQVAMLALSGFIVITALAWLIISNTNFLASSEFSYNAGLLGGFLMLCSLFYALFKRFKFINALGHNETWYYAHLVCGVLGTMIILFHTTFQIKSLNSAIALLCVLFVVVSGIFGRYICTLLSFQVQKMYEKIGEIELEIINALARHHQTTSKSVKNGITRLLVQGLGKKNHWYENIAIIGKLPYCAFRLYYGLRFQFRNLAGKSTGNGDLHVALPGMELSENNRLIRSYVTNIVFLCITQMVSGFLVHWRTIHSSVLYLLTLTALGHVLAVHMY